ncbi:MAG: hypothetical protein LBQ54_15680 [Planctomycetaceae bacterium]|jgi:hypothetical protein|nr:hypothetical protein [Planctomycetaceae bacterium]
MFKPISSAVHTNRTVQSVAPAAFQRETYQPATNHPTMERQYTPRQHLLRDTPPPPPQEDSGFPVLPKQHSPQTLDPKFRELLLECPDCGGGYLKYWRDTVSTSRKSGNKNAAVVYHCPRCKCEPVIVEDWNTHEPRQIFTIRDDRR